MVTRRRCTPSSGPGVRFWSFFDRPIDDHSVKPNWSSWSKIGKRIADQGLALAAISYDSVEVLKTFADRQHIGFELLSDHDSKVIRAYGILNETVAKGTPQFGIPYPGTYVLDVNGVHRQILRRRFSRA